MAHGLTAAHAAGLVHRDLKPENLFLTRSGPAKILDFGVAKLVHGSPVSGNQPATVAGMLVGTAGYLAPEQILGEAVDARADLFAFGAILYEMLTGRRAFEREHTIDTLYAVLREPVPSLREEPGVAPDMAAIADRLLEKDPDARFQSAADLAWTLERTACCCHRYDCRVAFPSSAVPVGHADGCRARRHPDSHCSVAASVVIGVVEHERRLGHAGIAQFTWRLPDDVRLASAPVVSPDGRRIAFVGATDSRSELWIRDLASLDARPIPGTAGAKQPFWSPDSRSLGFFANRKLLRVNLDSGAPQRCWPMRRIALGGTWGATGTIVFQPDVRDSSLMRISADGGRAEPATRLDITSDDVVASVAGISSRRRALPVLRDVAAGFAARRVCRQPRGTRRVAGPLGCWRGIQEPHSSREPTQTWARCSPCDRAAWRPGRSMPATRRFAGDATTIALPVADMSGRFPALLGASADVLALAATPIPFGGRLVVMSTAGDASRGDSRYRRSPGFRASRRTASGSCDRGWIRYAATLISGYRICERGTKLRLTTSRDMDVSPVWSPKGDRIAYRTGTGETQLAIVNADGTGTPVMFNCPRSPCEPTDWSIDGRMLLVNTGTDVWTVPVDSREPPAPLLASPFLERDARFSPDGRWIAYVSNEAGRLEVSIRTVTGPLRRIVVSNQGGDQPVWLSDGSALFYVDHEQLLQRVSLHVGPDGGLTLGRPERMRVPAFRPGHWGTTYDVSPDGTRIFLPVGPEAQAPREMTIVMGWSALLK